MLSDRTLGAPEMLGHARVAHQPLEQRVLAGGVGGEMLAV